MENRGTCPLVHRKGDTTMENELRGNTLEIAFEKLWEARSKIADLRALGHPLEDKATTRFLLAQEKAYDVLKAKDNDLYAELELATDAYIARVTQEHYRLGFQDALRLMVGA